MSHTYMKQLVTSKALTVGGGDPQSIWEGGGGETNWNSGTVSGADPDNGLP